jgi:hypothetical protein
MATEGVEAGPSRIFGDLTSDQVALRYQLGWALAVLGGLGIGLGVAAVVGRRSWAKWPWWAPAVALAGGIASVVGGSWSARRFREPLDLVPRGTSAETLWSAVLDDAQLPGRSAQRDVNLTLRLLRQVRPPRDAHWEGIMALIRHLPEKQGFSAYEAVVNARWPVTRDSWDSTLSHELCWAVHLRLPCQDQIAIRIALKYQTARRAVQLPTFLDHVGLYEPNVADFNSNGLTTRIWYLVCAVRANEDRLQQLLGTLDNVFSEVLTLDHLQEMRAKALETVATVVFNGWRQSDEAVDDAIIAFLRRWGVPNDVVTRLFTEWVEIWFPPGRCQEGDYQLVARCMNGWISAHPQDDNRRYFAELAFYLVKRYYHHERTAGTPARFMRPMATLLHTIETSHGIDQGIPIAIGQMRNDALPAVMGCYANGETGR